MCVGDDIIRVLALASVTGPFPLPARNTQVEPDTRSEGFSRKARGPVLGMPRAYAATTVNVTNE